VEKHGADEGIFAHGPVGFGRVGVLAFDPAVLGGPQAENLAPFWMEFTKPFLDRGALAAKPAASQEDEGYDYGYDETADSSNAVLTYLLDIPEMEPISILWVVGLLMTLAVVIGPVDYLILRKRDRLPLTWLTFAVYIGLFSVLAFFGVKALRAGDTQLRAVSVRDAVEGQEHRWASCYSGIFASDTDDYKLSGLEKSQWWSAIAPFSGPERLDAITFRGSQYEEYTIIIELHFSSGGRGFSGHWSHDTEEPWMNQDFTETVSGY
jgi:hypothetical protein